MASLNNKPVSLEEAVNSMRDNILRTQSTANTSSITGFDKLVEQLQVFAKQINDNAAEIIRLQDLCKKNKIDYSIPPPSPVAPHPSTQEITNPTVLKNPKN